MNRTRPGFPGFILLCLLLCSAGLLWSNAKEPFTAGDYFKLENVADPQISPDGSLIVFVRQWPDIMTDRQYSNLWIVNFDGSELRPLTTGEFSDSSPRWSPDGTRLAFLSNREGDRQIHVRWMDTGQTARITDIRQAPSNIAWSPDGKSIAFTSLVPSSPPQPPKMPERPRGANWADPPIIIDRLTYRANGSGYIPHGTDQIFVVSAEGGSPRQITSGEYFQEGIEASWTPDGREIIFSAIRKPDWEWIVRDSEVYAISVADGNIRTLTSRVGPDSSPTVSPDGKWIAYTGSDDPPQTPERRKDFRSYTVTKLYLMGIDGSNPKLLSGSVDNDVGNVSWSPDSGKIFFTVQERGSTNLYVATLDGQVSKAIEGIQQMGALTIARNGRAAATLTSPQESGNVVSFTLDKPAPKQITFMNRDLLAARRLGEVEEIWYKSSLDGKDIQGWIVKPPDFDPSKKYPLILYIHGGPHSMYGVSFNFEFQVHAGAENVVLYTNPRGSTGYGQEFGNIIQYKYPGDDYFDLMSGVDEVIKKGYVDSNNLFVTGGSGGGVLTCWVIGRTNRFAAAVSQYPVINWYSFVGTADFGLRMGYRWFNKWPWEDVEDYMGRSPIALVGNVTTPTMLITGEEDWRTPISDTEQYFRALKLQQKEARMVRVPGEPHGIRRFPSHYVAKIRHIQEWFEKHKRGDQ